MYLILGLMILSVATFAPPLKAYSGGVSPGDYQYGAPTCHSKQSGSTIEMTASNYTPNPGASVTVTVTVTGGEAGGEPLGVMIVSAFTSSSSLPSDDGWTITADPTGSTQYNYYEVDSYTGSLTATWTLNAPSTDGTYKLYAREVHGNGETYTNRFISGIEFTVGSVAPPTGFSVSVSSPNDGDEVSGNILVVAEIGPTASVLYAYLSVDGALVENKSAGPFTWSLDTNALADGEHVLRVTAANASGETAYEEIAVEINNGGESEELLAWMVTMGVGSIVIVTIIAMSIVIVLFIRKKLMDKKGAK